VDTAHNDKLDISESIISRSKRESLDVVINRLQTEHEPLELDILEKSKQSS
jgi:hypothetical protein